MRTILAGSLVILLTAVACGSEAPGPVATTEPTTTVASSLPTNTPIDNRAIVETLSKPTIDQTLLSFLLCDQLRAKMEMIWGQSPATIYSDDPRFTGKIVPGDFVRLLMAKPDDDGHIRVKVFPHDFRAVGQTDDQVWIDWAELTRFRLESAMFECEE